MAARKKPVIKTLQIPVASGYVDWGIWECLRELLQNAIDSRERGASFDVQWKEAGGGTLCIRNTGASIGRDKLRLGGTDKRGEQNQRGQFGEGMKLSWMRLVALEHSVSIRVGGEQWTPRIGHSEDFGGEVLFIDIAPTETHNDVYIEVGGITEESWLGVRERLLFMDPPFDSEVAVVSRGRVLRGEKYRGRLYSKGIYVCELAGSWKYGFDLDHVKLDRDRKVPDQFELQWELKTAFSEAATRKLVTQAEVMAVVDSDTSEARAMEIYAYSSCPNDALTQAVTDEFVQRYGESAVPVSGMSEATQVEQSGMKPVVVSKAARVMIERHVGRLEQRCSNAARDVIEVVQFSAFTSPQKELLQKATDLVRDAVPSWDGNLRIVKFRSDTVHGSYDAGNISLSHRLLDDPAELFSSLIHEVAHVCGPDGTRGHDGAIETIAGRIIAKLAGCL